MSREIEDGMGFAGLVGLSSDEREIERLLAENRKLRAEQMKCFHLGPRIPMVQHERPTCELNSGHVGEHEAHVGADRQVLKWLGVCGVCGGEGHVFDTLGHGPWDCWECREQRDEATRQDPLSEDSLQAIICSPNFRDYEKIMARELLRLRSSETDLSASNVQDTEPIRAALSRFVAAAKSWHDFHHGSKTVACDWICECIAPAEIALSAT
jgi:hypothetical protein